MAKRTIYKIHPGFGGKFALDFFRDKFMGIDFHGFDDLSDHVSAGSEKLKKFCDRQHKTSNIKKQITPLKAFKVLNMFSLEIKKKDIVICPDDCGNFAIGEVGGDYHYKAVNTKGKLLPTHRRKVKWKLDSGFSGADISMKLRNKLASGSRMVNISKEYDEDIQAELDKIIAGEYPKTEIYAGFLFDSEEEMEKHLCDHWDKCSLNEKYDLIKPDHELIQALDLSPNAAHDVGRQVITNVGIIDLLAISKKGDELLVIELKKKEKSDEVVGQVLRYMGFLKKKLRHIEPNIHVRGCIIAHGEDHAILCALDALEVLKDFQTADKIIEGVDFYRYESFKKNWSDFNLVKVDASKSV